MAERTWTLQEELEVCAWFITGTKRGEIVELAHFTRERIAEALLEASARITQLEEDNLKLRRGR